MKCLIQAALPSCNQLTGGLVATGMWRRGSEGAEAHSSPLAMGPLPCALPPRLPVPPVLLLQPPGLRGCVAGPGWHPCWVLSPAHTLYLLSVRDFVGAKCFLTDSYCTN